MAIASSAASAAVTIPSLDINKDLVIDIFALVKDAANAIYPFSKATNSKMSNIVAKGRVYQASKKTIIANDDTPKLSRQTSNTYNYTRWPGVHYKSEESNKYRILFNPDDITVVGSAALTIYDHLHDSKKPSDIDMV